MKILLLAPEPFFLERGTPIAIKLLAETLCEMNNSVDLLTYHQGKDISVKGLKIIRVPKIPFIEQIPIGFSFRKLFSDIIFAFFLLGLLIIDDYDVLHAVEESIFPAAFFNIFWKKKLIYDMDSSLAEQLCEKWGFLKNFKNLLNLFEIWAIKRANVIVPVCNYLAEKAKQYKSKENIYLLEDIAFEGEKTLEYVDNIREKLNLNSVIALYVGNLEHYQGIDLMLERSKTKVIFPIITFGLLLEYKKVKKQIFTDLEIKYLYENSVKYFIEFLGHDLHIGGKYYDAYPVRNLPKYGVLNVIGQKKYQLTEKFQKNYNELIKYIPNKIKEYIILKLGEIPSFANPENAESSQFHQARSK